MQKSPSYKTPEQPPDFLDFPFQSTFPRYQEQKDPLNPLQSTQTPSCLSLNYLQSATQHAKATMAGDAPAHVTERETPSPSPFRIPS